MDSAAFRAAVRAATAPGEPFETTVRRVNGVDFTAFVNAPEHLRDLYAEGLAYADRDLLVYQQERYSFQESWDLAAKCANRLLAEGIRPGDRVGIALRNYPEWAFAYMGITSIGAIAVAMNAWWTTEEMIYGVEDSGLSVLFVDRERLERIGDHANASVSTSSPSVARERGGAPGKRSSRALRARCPEWNSTATTTR